MSERMNKIRKFKREYELELAGLRLESDTLCDRLSYVSKRADEVKDQLSLLADFEENERKRIASES